jgi:triosephosphate isomerase
VDRDKLAHLMVAYEPVWAIGTGRTATPADAAEVHDVIRREIREQLGDRSGGIHILYGGSVNRGNAAQLLAGPGIDGLLVGGASLDAEGWSSIVRA